VTVLQLLYCSYQAKRLVVVIARHRIVVIFLTEVLVLVLVLVFCFLVFLFFVFWFFVKPHIIFSDPISHLLLTFPKIGSKVIHH
jgi:amino acid permease